MSEPLSFTESEVDSQDIESIGKLLTKISGFSIVLIYATENSQSVCRYHQGLTEAQLPTAESIENLGPFVRDQLVLKSVEGDTRLPTVLATTSVEGLTSLLAFRLRDQNGQVIGLLTLIAQKEDQLNWDQLEKLSLMAAHLSQVLHLILDNHRLNLEQKRFSIGHSIAHVGFWSFEIGSGKIHWSSEIYRIHGLTDTSSPPNFQQLMSLYDSASGEKLAKAVELAISKGVSYQIDLGLLTPSGEIRRAIGFGQPIFDKNKQVVEIHGALIDVTDRDRLNQQLNATQKRLQLALQSAAMGVWQWDIRENKLTWDNGMYQLYGIEVAEIQATAPYETWESALFPADKSRVLAELEAAVKKGIPFNCRYRIVHPNGKIRYIQANALLEKSAVDQPGIMIGVNIDVTREAEAYATLEQQNATLNSVEEQLRASSRTSSIIEFDPDGTILWANENFLQLTGYSLPELTGQNHSIFVPFQNRRSSSYKDFWSSLKNGEHCAGEFKLLAKNNHDVWFSGAYYPIFGSDGCPRKIVIMAIDVTLKKLESLDHHQQIDGLHSSHAVMEFDLDGNILFANQIVLDLFGYQLEELIGKNHRMMVPDQEKIDNKYRDFWQCLRQGSHQSGVFRRLKKSGDLIYLSGSYNPIFGMNGEPYKIVSYTLDFTKEKSLQFDSEEKIAAINKANAIIEFDKNGIILDANENFLRLMKYSRSEVLGLHHSIFIQEKQAEQADYLEFWNKLKSGEHQSGDFQRFNKFGGEVWIRGSYNPHFDLRGSLTKVIKFAFDITNEKKAQQELLIKNYLLEDAAQNSNSASKMKTLFLANMSHEIRTPLNGIIGMTELLLESPLDSQQRDITATISNSGKMLLSIVNDILDFSKVEAGKMDLELVEFNLKDLFNELGSHFRFDAKRKGLSFRIEAPSNSLAIIGDSGRLGQIIHNLVGNSIKFTNKGEVVLKCEQIAETMDDLKVKITVSDTGVGIPHQAKAKIFESFTQAEASTSRSFGGTGLGLSISRSLARLMGGDITFESQEGIGTTFLVELTFKKGEAKRESASPMQTSIVAIPERIDAAILVAEDNLVNQKVISLMLEKIGCKYSLVANGLEAIAALRTKDFDAILMDCHMPQMDGYEATKTIRKGFDKRNAEIPIIALTANAMKGEELACREAGMNGFLTKPVVKKDLIEALRKYIKSAA